MVLAKDDLLQLQLSQKEVIKADSAIKRQIELLRSLTYPDAKQVSEKTQYIKQKLAVLEQQINALEKFSSKVRTVGERRELYDQIKEHRNEVERNKLALRKALVSLKLVIDEQARHFLFKSNVDDHEVELRNRMKKVEDMKKDAFQATEDLSNLVSRMSDQVKLAEETTSNLIHSSSVLKSTESEFASMTTHITSGGKLISKYGRRECTDRVLLAIALIVYFAVILYILRKRVVSIVF